MKKTITKIFAGLLCLVLLGGVLCGCLPQYASTSTNNNSQDSAAISKDYFEQVGRDDAFFILREKRTDVMYIAMVVDGGYDGQGGLTVMLAPDGTPLLYSEWVEMGE